MLGNKIKKLTIVQKCGRDRFDRCVGKRRGVAKEFLEYRYKLATEVVLEISLKKIRDYFVCKF